MLRKIININTDKCNGCGACANACHEGAIGMVNGKAKLLREDYCDGLGDCLPACPTNAITFVEREAPEYNAKAVEENRRNKMKENFPHTSCPGHQLHKFNRNSEESEICSQPNSNEKTEHKQTSQLGQWPCQIKLVPTNAPYFENAKLLIAADCTAYAYANMHSEFMSSKITLIGCPKLDSIDYSEKLTEILKNNNIRSLTVVRMEVPCCGGLEMAATKALKDSGKFIPWQIVTISIDGKILNN